MLKGVDDSTSKSGLGQILMLTINSFAILNSLDCHGEDQTENVDSGEDDSDPFMDNSSHKMIVK